MTSTEECIKCGHKCCKFDRHTRVLIDERLGDDMTLEHYEIPVWGEKALRVLKVTEDGKCVYLEDGVGCAIYDRRPAQCVAYPCGAKKERQ